MTPRVRFNLTFFAYPLSAGSAIASFGAYFSGDASGLQYIFLDWAKWLAITAGVLLIAFRLRISVHWGQFLLPIVCYLVADLPRVTGAGYNGAVIDRPGALLAALLLLIVFVVMIRAIYRIGAAS